MNPHDFGRFCAESLESAAKHYKTLGFSIIPLNGARNQTQPKLPLIKWGRYQHSIATDEEVHNWFGQQADIGIGIVCGRVSRLVVLDFDDAGLASEFRRLHPELVDTFTVRSGTRGLPHYYFRLPVNKVVTTSAFPGADLRGEGSYVVAAPTHVGNTAWVVENDVAVRDIAELELRQIMRFLNDAKTRSSDAIQSPVIALEKVEASEFRRLLTTDELVVFYERHSVSGRNQALFQAAVMARDCGMTEARCCLLLAAVHAQKRSGCEEDYGERFAEGLRTISSAYSRPMRSQDKSVKRLGNAVREWLLINRLTVVARVLDGLYAAEMPVGSCFTELEVCKLLARFKIGRRSVMAALKALVCDRPVFSSGQTPLNPPDDANAANRSEDLNNSCEMSRGAKRVKIQQRGRPARLYRLPSPDEVATLIGVQQTGGDALEGGELSSPKSYRAALHAQLLERRPAHYARGWLASRLGVSRWTLRRYEKSAGIAVQPSYSIQMLTWALAGTLPESADGAYGVFIETFEGKRYPALRGLAFKLLKDRKLPVLKHQQPNYYSTKLPSVGIPTLPAQAFAQGDVHDVYGRRGVMQPEWQSGVGIPTPQSVDKAACQGVEGQFESGLSHIQTARSAGKESAPSVGIPTPQASEQTFWLCPECLDFHIAVQKPDQCQRCGARVDWEVVPRSVWRDAQALKLWWQERYRSHHGDLRKERLGLQATEPKLSTEAKSLVDRIRTQIPDMSFSNARRIVSQFGAQLIEKALAALGQRNDIRKPAGFVMAFLKSERRLLLSDNNSLAARRDVKQKGESRLDWLRRMVKSQYVSFMANADELLNWQAEVCGDVTPA